VDQPDRTLGDGCGIGVLRSVGEGKYRPHKKLLDHTAAMIKGEPSYVLLDEQQVVFKTILAKVAETRDLGTKAVFVIRGGPGTGKSVIALNLVAELAANRCAVHHATGSAAFTNTVRKRGGTRASGMFMFFNSYLNAEDDTLDVLVCDEAHRIRKFSWDRFRKKDAVDPGRPQIDELLSVARVGVFFIDYMQAVKRDEIGNSDDIERLAETHGAEVHEFELEAQYRCGGSDGFVRWIESTLGIRRTANALWTGDDNFDFDIVDSPEHLDAHIRQRAEEGRSARARRRLLLALVGAAQRRHARSRRSGRRVAPTVERTSERDRAGGGDPEVVLLGQRARRHRPCRLHLHGAGVRVRGRRDLRQRPRLPAARGWIGRKEASYDGGLKRGTSDEDLTRLVKNTYRALLSRVLKSGYVDLTDEKTRDFFESTMDRLALELAAEREAGYGSEAS
jgi:uncharacterized protein